MKPGIIKFNVVNTMQYLIMIMKYNMKTIFIMGEKSVRNPIFPSSPFEAISNKKEKLKKQKLLKLLRTWTT